MTFWIAGAGLAMGAVGMIGGAQTAGAQAKGAIATTKAGLELNKANQHGENAKAGLSNFMTAFNNNRQLKQYGKAMAAAKSNANLAKDSQTSNKLEEQIRASEQAGALAANMGFSGTAGASFDAIAASSKLRDARVKENQERNANQLNYNAAQQQLGLIDNGLMGLDLSVNSGGVDASVMAPSVTGGTNYLSAIGSSGMLGQLSTMIQSLPSNTGPRANLTGGTLGLRPGTGAPGLTLPSASTSFFNLGGGSINYSLF